jgi:hypothetical protein
MKLTTSKVKYLLLIKHHLMMMYEGMEVICSCIHLGARWTKLLTLATLPPVRRRGWAQKLVRV